MTTVSISQPETPSLPATTPDRTARYLKWALFAWILAISAFHLGCAALGKSIYRDIHLGTAIEYSKGPINLLKPMIVGFNLNGVPTPQELPVWQATAGFALKVLGPWFGWANLVSLLFLFSCLYPLFRLAERFAGPGCGWWALILFLAQPIVAYAAGCAGTDGQSIAATVWFLFFASKLWDEQNLKWLALTAAFGSWAAVSKLPLFMAAGLGCVFMSALHYRKTTRAWVYLALAALVIGAAFFAWTRYTNWCFAQAELPLVDLRVSTSEVKDWYFGDLAFRLSPKVWLKGGWRFLGAGFGSFALVALLLLGLVWRQGSKLGRAWLAGALVSTAIFFHLVLVHSHYYLMFAPALALICAPIALQAQHWLTSSLRVPAWLTSAILLGALALATAQGFIVLNVTLALDNYPRAMAALIRQYTSPQDKLVISGGGWGGELLFLSDRRGLSVWTTAPLEDPKTYARLKSLGFTKLVMVSETPLMTAIREHNYPSGGLVRQTYRASSTPLVGRLPTVFQTEDILIKEMSGS